MHRLVASLIAETLLCIVCFNFVTFHLNFRVYLLLNTGPESAAHTAGNRPHRLHYLSGPSDVFFSARTQFSAHAHSGQVIYRYSSLGVLFGV